MGHIRFTVCVTVGRKNANIQQSRPLSMYGYEVSCNGVSVQLVGFLGTVNGFQGPRY